MKCNNKIQLMVSQVINETLADPEKCPMENL